MTFLANYFQKVNLSRRYQLDVVLKTWRDFLQDMGIPRTLEELMTDALVWEEVTGTLLYYFRQHLLNEGYSKTTIDRQLALLRLIIRQAQQAGALIPAHELEHIVQIRGYRGERGKPLPYVGREEIDDTEAVVYLSSSQTYRLKHAHPNTPRGHRDALLMCLLLDQGLSAIDIRGLQVQDVDLAQGILLRPKAEVKQSRALSEDTLQTLRCYLADHPLLQHGPLYRIIKRDGTVGNRLLIPRDIVERVKILGINLLEIPTLTPQVCHMYWTRVYSSSPPVEK
jgi:integrase